MASRAHQLTSARASQMIHHSSAEFIVFFLNFFVVFFSLMAGAFWMASAYGRSVTPLFKQSTKAPLADLAAHQSLWNGRAALCAACAAISQALLFLYNYYHLTIPHFS
jgi:hypothetical protein